MKAEKIIRQALKKLGMNLFDMDINTNPYYKNLAIELEDMRTQILDSFSFQIKIAYNLAKLPTIDFPDLYVNNLRCLAYTLPTDFMGVRLTDQCSQESVRIKGNVVYIPEVNNYLEYFSSSVPYEDFPVYAEDYVVACLVSRSAVLFGKPTAEFEQKEYEEKLKLKNKENQNTGFNYVFNDLVRR